MQKISVFVVFLGGVLSVACALAAEPGVEVYAGGLPPGMIESSAGGGISYSGPCYGRPCCNHGAGTCFNCYCRGSYKYPVPPRDMYFWPGIYSQKTMTAYVSPYRYPGLLMPEIPAGPSGSIAVLPVDLPQVTAAPAKTESPSR